MSDRSVFDLGAADRSADRQSDLIFISATQFWRSIGSHPPDATKLHPPLSAANPAAGKNFLPDAGGTIASHAVLCYKNV
jgi:hypothetical protein